MFSKGATGTLVGGSMDTAINAIWLTRWLLTIPFAFLFVWAATFNASVWWRRFIRREENTPSIGPFVGGFSGMCAMQLCPILGTLEFAWLPLVLDVGCLPFFSLLAWFYLTKRQRL